ncbi:MAG: Fic family protein, partial [Actinomycetota bacterium]|nr:Fic family protein [Actinomycetota bacterium]
MPQVFAAPELDSVELEVLGMINELRDTLSSRMSHKPRQWGGSLRRMSFARAVQGSNSIEGYEASLDDVVAAVDDEPTAVAPEETRLALAGYRDAMTYVLQVSEDSAAVVDEGLLKSLHFMMLKHRLDKGSGLWRPGEIYVRRDDTGDLVYKGPDADDVPSLVQAALRDLEQSDAPVLVRAAMAHLNLVMIHPFRDGNGRMARCLQTLILARERIVAPTFSSIEEYLGRNTESYYDVLATVGEGVWNPGNDARPWLRYCLTAHYHQARTMLRRIQEVEGLYNECFALAESKGLPERTAGPLAEAAHGFRLRNSSYRAVVEITSGEELSDLTASRDLRAIVEAGLFEAVGERRGRYYLGAEVLFEIYRRVRVGREPKDRSDPFERA